MIFEKFSTGTSYLHRADSAIKIVCSISLVVVLALSQTYITATIGLCISLIFLFGARLSISSVCLRLLIVNGFVAFLWVTLPITYPGNPLVSIGPISISQEGVALAALITIKTNAIILLLISLMATSSIADIGRGLERLRVPAKLCLLMLFSYRYISVIYQEYLRLARAAKLRCFTPSTNLHTYKTYSHLFGMTLIKSLHRAKRVQEAMLLRGFHGRFYSLHEPRIGPKDILLLGVCLGISIGLGVIEYSTRF